MIHKEEAFKLDNMLIFEKSGNNLCYFRKIEV